MSAMCPENLIILPFKQSRDTRRLEGSLHYVEFSDLLLLLFIQIQFMFLDFIHRPFSFI
jgi:hypothetical protein